MVEIWKDIPSWEGIYQVSNIGNIRSFHNNKVTLLKTDDSHGYRRCLLQKEGRKIKYLVHLLILLTFVGDSSLPTNHKNGVKHDNTLENLEYCTYSANNAHAYKHNLASNQGIRHPQARFTEAQIRRIKFIALHMNPERGYWAKLSRVFGVGHETIMAIVHERSWSHIKV
jgi:hypothetical protein